MRATWWFLLALSAGCARDRESASTSASPERPTRARADRPAALRSADELLAAVRDYRKRADLPRSGASSFLQPPREEELAWINDPARSLAERLDRSLQLYDDSKEIMKRYGSLDAAADSAESLRWAESTVRQFGHIASAMVEEFLPTLTQSDPSYAVRLEGVDKMRAGAAGMLQGALITLGAQRSELPERQWLAGAWRDHAPRFSRLWRQADCDQLAASIREVAASQTDRVIRQALGDTASALVRCTGGAAP